MSSCEQQRAARAMLCIMNKHQLYCSGCAWNTILDAAGKLHKQAKSKLFCHHFAPARRCQMLRKLICHRNLNAIPRKMEVENTTLCNAFYTEMERNALAEQSICLFSFL